MHKSYKDLSVSVRESRNQEVNLSIGRGRDKDTVLNLDLNKEQTEDLIKMLFKESHLDKEEIAGLIKDNTGGIVNDKAS